MSKQLPLVFRHSVSDSLKMAIVPMDCALRLRDGPVQIGDWDTVASRLNIGTVLARWHFPDAKPELATASDIIAANQTLTQEQHAAVEIALNLVTQMEGKVTRRELSKAILYVFKTAGKK